MLHKPVQWFWMLFSVALMGLLAYGIVINGPYPVRLIWADNVYPSMMLAVPLIIAAAAGALVSWAWMQAALVGSRHGSKQASKLAEKSKMSQEDTERQLNQANQTIATLETALNKALSSPSPSSPVSPSTSSGDATPPPATSGS